MYYNPDYINWGPTGWTCPKCGRVYGPNQPMCLYCNDRRITYVTKTTAKPEWIYKEDTRTGVVEDEWRDYTWSNTLHNDNNYHVIRDLMVNFPTLRYEDEEN